MSSFNRRSFLSVFVSAIAAGTVLTAPSIAQALVLAPDEDRIKRSVTWARELLVQTQLLKLNSPGERYHGTQGHEGFMANADAWIDYMLDRFPEQPLVQDVSLMFDHPWVHGVTNALDENRVRGLAESIVPIFLIRACVQTHRMPFVMSRMPAFTRFADVYREVVMGDPPRDPAFDDLCELCRVANTEEERTLARLRYAEWRFGSDRAVII